MKGGEEGRKGGRERERERETERGCVGKVGQDFFSLNGALSRTGLLREGDGTVAAVLLCVQCMHETPDSRDGMYRLPCARGPSLHVCVTSMGATRLLPWRQTPGISGGGSNVPMPRVVPTDPP